MKLLLPSLLLLATLASATAQDRPNIVWLTSEDNSFHWLGCYGNEQARTPHLDRLAEEGTRYAYAYANTPVCAVARFTLITGRYACSMGTQNMRSRYPIPSPDQTFVSYLREAGYYCTNNAKTDYNFATRDKAHWDACGGEAHWKNRPTDAPFFAVFNTTISHESCLFPDRTASFRKQGLIPPQPSRDPGSATLPPFLPDTPELRQDWVTYMDVMTAMDKQIGVHLQELADAGLADNTIVIYYGDHGGILPRSKRYIYDTGTHVPMIARVPERWAQWAPGEPGIASDRLVSFIDLPPTVLSLAGLPIPEHMQGRAFLGEQARDGAPYVFLYGQRFDARMLRFVRAVTDGRYRYIRNFYPHRHRGILTGYPHGQAGWQSYYALQRAGKTTPAQAAVWKTPQPVEELYDTRADPWEVINLADAPGHQDTLVRMRQELVRTLREVRDTGLVPESMYNRLSDGGTIYDYVNDPRFPYDRILELALAAGDGRLEAPELRAAMADRHPVIRAWGALGCTLQGPAARPASQDLMRLLQDPVPAVRLAAAEALVAQGETDSGVETLVAILAETRDDMVALEALNLVQSLGVADRIPREVYDRACQTGNYPQRMAEDTPR